MGHRKGIKGAGKKSGDFCFEWVPKTPLMEKLECRVQCLKGRTTGTEIFAGNTK